MGDQSIPAPDFNAEVPFNSISDDQFIEEEADSFRDLMESSDKEQEKVQEEARTQVEKNKDSLKSLVQKEEMDKEASLEQEEHGIEEEDSKKLSEDQEAKSGEETRLASLEESKQEKSVEKESSKEEDTKQVQKGDKEGLDRRGAAKMTKHHLTRDQMTREHQEDAAQDLDDQLASKDKVVTNKAHARAMRQEEELAHEKSSFQDRSKTESKPTKKTEKKTDAQSIAANLALGSQPLEASKSQKGNLDSRIEKTDLRKELEGLVKKIMEEAEVLRNGDEVQTTISLNMPDSVFNDGEIMISAFKYRPLEVNLKFSKFNAEGSKLLKQNQEDLKNVLKINSLKVHQLEIIE